MNQVAALFVREDSIYKQLPGVDAWDAGQGCAQVARRRAVRGSPALPRLGPAAAVRKAARRRAGAGAVGR